MWATRCAKTEAGILVLLVRVGAMSMTPNDKSPIKETQQFRDLDSGEDHTSGGPPDVHRTTSSEDTEPGVSFTEVLLEIRDLIEKRLSYDNAKEQAFDRLYADLDATRRNAAFTSNRPLYIDLILLYDRIDVACKQAKEQTYDFATSLRDELTEILLRQNIHRIQDSGHIFNPRLQRAISTEEVVSPAEDCTVVRVVREGFACGEDILRPQEVVVGVPESSAPHDISTQRTEECSD